MLDRWPANLDDGPKHQPDTQPSDLERFPELCGPECQECAVCSPQSPSLAVGKPTYAPWVQLSNITGRGRGSSTVEPARWRWERQQERQQQQTSQQPPLTFLSQQQGLDFLDYRREAEEILQRNMEDSRRCQEEPRIRMAQVQKRHEEFIRSLDADNRERGRKSHEEFTRSLDVEREQEDRAKKRSRSRGGEEERERGSSRVRDFRAKVAL